MEMAGSFFPCVQVEVGPNGATDKLLALLPKARADRPPGHGSPRFVGATVQPHRSVLHSEPDPPRTLTTTCTGFARDPPQGLEA